jgi:uncharacterized protein
MVKAADIYRICDQIAQNRGVEKVLLFGSYAYGTPTVDSDVDFLVVKPYRGSSPSAATRVGASVRPDFPTDIIVRSPAEIRRRLDMNDFFVREIIERGIVLYDRNNERMGTKGRERLRRRLHSPSITQTRAV